MKDDGSDDHIKNGDVGSRGSKVKSHVSSSTGWNLTKKEKGLLKELHEAHDAAEEAKKSGDDAAYMENKEKFDSLTSQLEDEGLDRSDFLHEDDDDRPKNGPPDPETAKRMIAEGWMWHEETRSWVKKKNWEDRVHGSDGVTGMGSLGSYAGAGHHLGIAQAEMVNGELNITPDTREFVHSQDGLHVSDSDTQTAPGSHKEMQGKLLGQVKGVSNGINKAHKTGKQQYIAYNDHKHLTGHGHSDGPPQEALERGARAVGRGAKKVGSYLSGSQSGVNRAVGRGAASAAGKAKDLISGLFKEDFDNLSSIEKLQVHIAIQKLEEKDTTRV